MCGLPSLTNTVFHPVTATPVLSSSQQHTCAVLDASSLRRFLYCVWVVVSIRFTVTVLRVREQQQIRTTKTSYFQLSVLMDLSIPATIMTATIHLIRAGARLNPKVLPVHSQRRNTIPDNKLADHFFFAIPSLESNKKNVYFVHAIIRNPRRALCHTHFDRSRGTVATGCR